MNPEARETAAEFLEREFPYMFVEPDDAIRVVTELEEHLAAAGILLVDRKRLVNFIDAHAEIIDGEWGHCRHVTTSPELRQEFRDDYIQFGIELKPDGSLAGLDEVRP